MACENNAMVAEMKVTQGKRLHKELEDISFVANLLGNLENVVVRDGELACRMVR